MSRDLSGRKRLPHHCNLWPVTIGLDVDTTHLVEQALPATGFDPQSTSQLGRLNPGHRRLIRQDHAPVARPDYQILARRSPLGIWHPGRFLGLLRSATRLLSGLEHFVLGQPHFYTAQVGHVRNSVEATGPCLLAVLVENGRLLVCCPMPRADMNRALAAGGIKRVRPTGLLLLEGKRSYSSLKLVTVGFSMLRNHENYAKVLERRGEV
jgi:hypothetical protein